MNLLEIFANNIRQQRIKQGISQEKLAELSELHRTYISDIERCQRNISLNNLEKISKALKVEPYQLLMEKVKHDE